MWSLVFRKCISKSVFQICSAVASFDYCSYEQVCGKIKSFGNELPLGNSILGSCSMFHSLQYPSCIQAWKGLALPWVEAFLLKGGVGTTLQDNEGSQLIHLHFAHCTESETNLSTISSFCVFPP